MIRLGFHSHVPACEIDNQIRTEGPQGLFLDSIAPFCQQITGFFHSPATSEQDHMDYPVHAANINWVNLGTKTSVPGRTIRSRKFTLPIQRKSGLLDLLLIRGPSPLLPAAADCTPDIPKALLLVASYSAGLEALPQPGWRKQLIRLWVRWYETNQLRIAQDSLTFVNSHKLYSELKPFVADLIETKTSTLRAGDICLRQDACSTPPYRILFVGRLTPEKGIENIFEAVAELRREQIPCCLDIVGPLYSQSFGDDLNAFARSLGIHELVRFHGYQSLENGLFRFYRQADLFITASLSSAEGFPRTIWEAFSQCAPVVATEVGSIPHYLTHERDALLAPPGRPQDLAECMKRIIFEPELRRRLIANGLIQAQNNTLEARAKEMVLAMETWLNKKNAEPNRVR